jgi:GNAT superfamily N-acetyltransferase
MEPKPQLSARDKSVDIRRFIDEDAGEISYIILRCLREINSKDYGPEVIEAMSAHFAPETMVALAGTREVYVAVKEGKPVGTVSRDENKAYTLFVNPDFVGQSIGGKLMDHIEQLATNDGFGFMETGASITAHDFYRNRGYVHIHESETEFGLNYILRKPI